MPTGGMFGEAIVTLMMDQSGRWLERVNGWGETEREIDLREYEVADRAIVAVLQ